MDYVQGPTSARVTAAVYTPEQLGWATSAVAAVGGGGGILQLTHPSAAPQVHPLWFRTRTRMIPQPRRGSAYTASVLETQGMPPCRILRPSLLLTLTMQCQHSCTPEEFLSSLARSSGRVSVCDA